MGCVFCDIVTGRAPASMVLESEQVVAFLDVFPMRPGHTLLVPRRHTAMLDELGEGERAGLFAQVAPIVRALRLALPCAGVNVVLNDGRAANQTIPHVHVHLIPRAGGDLPRLLAKLLVRPVQPLLGGPARARLDEHAARIRARLG